MEATHLFYAAFCTWKKDYPKALWAVRRTKELSRSPHLQAYAWEIVTLVNLGRLREALDVSRKVLELQPDFPAERWVASTGIFNEEEQAGFVGELHRAGYP